MSETTNLTSEEDETMSTTDETSNEISEIQFEQDPVLNGVDTERFTVRLSVPVDTTDPEAAVELVMQDISYYGLKQYIWVVEHDESRSQWYVGERGVMSSEEVDEVAGGGEEPDDVAEGANDVVADEEIVELPGDDAQAAQG